MIRLDYKLIWLSSASSGFDIMFSFCIEDVTSFHNKDLHHSLGHSLLQDCDTLVLNLQKFLSRDMDNVEAILTRLYIEIGNGTEISYSFLLQRYYPSPLI